MRNISGFLAAAALLDGCASMDKNQCQNANWYAIGLEDLSREAEQLERQLARAQSRR